MTARIVRANYDDLAKVAGVFSQHAALTERTLQGLRQQLETLRGGDWLGQGAHAFYLEMDSQVVPSMGRLIHALGQAADTTRQISQIVHEAESQAAAVFKSTGEATSPASGGAAAGSSAGGLAGAAAALGGMGTSGAAGAGAGMPAGAEAFTTTTVGAAPAAGAATSAAGNTVRPSEAFLTSFGAEYRDRIEKSPTLLRELYVLESVGWHVFHVQSPPNPPLTKLDRASKEILIGSDSHAGHQVMSLALEIGGYLGPRRDVSLVTPGMTKDDYVRLNVNEDLIAEGSKQLNLQVINDELLQHHGVTVHSPGGYNDEEKRRIWDISALYERNQINRDQAVQQVADVLGAHVPENGKISVWDAKAKWFATQWDNIAKEQGWTQ